MDDATIFLGSALLGGALGFFVGGWLKQIDLWREGEKQRREDARRLKQTYQDIEEREKKIKFVLAHYARDRILALLESPQYEAKTLDQCLDLAGSLDVDFPEPNLPWAPPARQLLTSWPANDRWGKTETLSISRLQEISDASEAFVDACEYVTYDEAREFVAFMSLGTSETLEQVSKRIKADGHIQVSAILKRELKSHQSNYSEDDFE
ncbi:hypothetical protein [Hyphomonas sp. CACIAM 19H1]|uniref:hypothetical protein n=1 Tax=Hyphomonas sp. CACIAM 19H1 TaxID=1873716 RepID=UPI0013B054DD|nr:hypothetical protein [Hyphomonas sp. CACIAM 19H1]